MEYREICRLVLPKFLEYLNSEGQLNSLIPVDELIDRVLGSVPLVSATALPISPPETEKEQEERNIGTENQTSVPPVPKKRVYRKKNTAVPEDNKEGEIILESAPEPSKECQTCHEQMEDGVCPKCESLRVETTPAPKRGGKKKKEVEELIDPIQQIYRNNNDKIQFAKLADGSKIILGQCGTKGAIIVPSKKAIQKFIGLGYIERIKHEGGNKYRDLLKNLALIKKGDIYVANEKAVPPELIEYCQHQGYKIERMLLQMPLDEARGIFLDVEYNIVIRLIDDKPYAQGLYTGKAGVLDELGDKEIEAADKLGYLVQYNKHLLVEHPATAEVEPPQSLPEI